MCACVSACVRVFVRVSWRARAINVSVSDDNWLSYREKDKGRERVVPLPYIATRTHHSDLVYYYSDISIIAENDRSARHVTTTNLMCINVFIPCSME